LARCFFVSDLHGDHGKYRRLVQAIAVEGPDAVFVGGDLLPATPSVRDRPSRNFVRDFLVPSLEHLKCRMGERFPRVLLIMGNDDKRIEEREVQEAECLGLVEYIHQRVVSLGSVQVYGYACVPPTPFLLKDWERYDVSRYVDPGCISPEEGTRSVPISEIECKYGTIKADLERLAGDAPLDRAVFLFHAPPYSTCLDHAGLDDVRIDGVRPEVHVGSIAIRQLIEERQPLLTLHGHIHESAELSHAWRDRIGRTLLFSAAHAGGELALIRFNLESPADATRELI
jgi:Icc-related predicted phosphoesterase